MGIKITSAIQESERLNGVICGEALRQSEMSKCTREVSPVISLLCFLKLDISPIRAKCQEKTQDIRQFPSYPTKFYLASVRF